MYVYNKLKIKESLKMSKSYLLPEEISLAKEIDFAVKEYGIINHSDEKLLRNINDSKDWILDPDLMHSLELKIKEAANNPLKTKGGKALNYLFDLKERVSLQKEIALNARAHLDLSDFSPKKLAEINFLSYPTISKNFYYRFQTDKEKAEGFAVLKNLPTLRPYLEKLQPYLNHMSNTYIPTKDRYHPKQIEFSLPILFKIEQAKEQGYSDVSIEKAIDFLNKNRITSPEHFQAVLYEIENHKVDFDNIENKNTLEGVSPEISEAIQEAIQAAQNSKIGLPLTDTQIAILSKAEHPVLAKEVGEIMSKGYAPNDVAEAILDNVNIMSRQNPELDYKYLTQAFSLVSELSKISAKEMRVLGGIMLNSGKELSFHNIRQAANEMKSMDGKTKWSPPKHLKQNTNKKREFSLEER